MSFETGKLLFQHEFFRMVSLAGHSYEAEAGKKQSQCGRATLLCCIRARNRGA